jgi:hypothetical protein
LPGLFEVERIVQLAQEHNTEILAKLVFGFTPDIILSPLALPRAVLDRKIDQLVPLCSGALQAVLLQLRTRPTVIEQWGHGEASAQISKGKRRILQLERIRRDTYTLGDILAQDPEIGAWYDSIA